MNLEKLKCPCCGQQALNIKLIPALEKLELLHGKPLQINSGYRCEKHNAMVGGAEHSRHLTGEAVDLGVESHDERERLIDLGRACGFYGIGRGASFVHLDLRPKPGNEWTY